MTDYAELYYTASLNLAKTLVIKSPETAELRNRALINQLGAAAVDRANPASWVYYQHLAGIYHSTDTPMRVQSLDTFETIDFTQATLADHPSTAQGYQYGTSYFRALAAAYPTQRDLILGILYPVPLDTAIAAPNWSIVGYPGFLVEAQEITLIEELDRWVQQFQARWRTPAYYYTASYYPIFQHALMYLGAFQKLLNLRLARCHTPEAHSFHVRRYLAAHGNLDRYYDYLTVEQRYFLYRNLRWIEANLGKQFTFDWLVDRLLNRRGISLSHYSVQHQDTFNAGDYPDLVLTKSLLTRSTSSVATAETPPRTVLAKEDALAPGNLVERLATEEKLLTRLQSAAIGHLPTKVLHAVAYDYSDSYPFHLEEVILNAWLYLSITARYPVAVHVLLPRMDTEVILTSTEAFLVFLYQSSKHFGFPLDQIPANLTAVRIPCEPNVTVADLLGVVDRHEPGIEADAEWLRMQPRQLMTYTSTKAFFEASQTLYRTMIREWRYTAHVEPYKARGYVAGMVERCYRSATVALPDGDSQFSAWLSARGLPDFDYTLDERATLLTRLFLASTGYAEDPTKKLKNIQAAMVAILKQLSSYTVQWLSETNITPLTPVQGAATRLQDVTRQEAARVQIPFLGKNLRVSSEIDLFVSQVGGLDTVGSVEFADRRVETSLLTGSARGFTQQRRLNIQIGTGYEITALAENDTPGSIVTPTVLPLPSAEATGNAVVLRSSRFLTHYQPDELQHSAWQLALEPTFTAPLQEATLTLPDPTRWAISGLTEATTYYARVQYSGLSLGSSAWSPPYSFTTRLHFVDETVLAAEGPIELYTHQTAYYHLVNFDPSIEYTATAIAGTATLLADTIEYTAPGTPGEAGFNVLYLPHPVTILRATGTTPVIVTPTDPAELQLAEVVFGTAPFTSQDPVDQLALTDWQLAKVPQFTLLEQSAEGITGTALTWVVAGLTEHTDYYLRIRQAGLYSDYSDWSEPWTFTTMPLFEAPILGGSGIQYTGSTVVYPIENFSPTGHYVASADVGAVNITGSMLSYTAPASAGLVHLTISGYPITLSVLDAEAFAPLIISPIGGSVGLGPVVPVEAELFAIAGDTHLASQWQLSTLPDFSTLTATVTVTEGELTSAMFAGLPEFTQFYLRVMYQGEDFGWTPWSPITTFRTRDTYEAPTVQGPTTLVTTLSGSYQITNYDAELPYTLTAVTGEVIRDQRFITYTAPSTAGAGGFILNGTLVPVNIAAPYIARPTISAPANASSQISVNPIVAATGLVCVGASDALLSADWELSTEESFTPVIRSVYNSFVSLTQWSLVDLAANSRYYVRTRQRGAAYGVSSWSLPVSFLTETVIPASQYATSGPQELSTGQTGYYRLLNYNSEVDYQITTDSGLVQQTGYLIAYTAPAVVGLAGFSVNGNLVPVTISPAIPNAPTINLPVAGLVNAPRHITLTASVFASSDPTVTHASSEWELAEDSSFTLGLIGSGSASSHLTQFAPPGLKALTLYYVRVRYTGSNGHSSPWSSSYTLITEPALSPLLQGPTTLYAGATATYEIIDYDPEFDYAASVSNGSLSQTAAVLTYTAPAVADNVTLVVGGRSFALIILAPYVAMPSVVSPAQEAYNLALTETVRLTPFIAIGATDAWSETHWQLSLTSDFAVILQSGTTTQGAADTFALTGLSYDTLYYLRVRYSGVSLGASAWSPVQMFRTRITDIPLLALEVSGPSTLTVNETVRYTLVHYDPAVPYEVSALNGAVTRIGQYIDYTAPANQGACGFAVNTNWVALVATAPWLEIPSVLVPNDQAIGLGATVSFVATPFRTHGTTDTHLSSQWQLSPSELFNTGVIETTSTSDLTSWGVVDLLPDTWYYVRVKYQGQTLGATAWSEPSAFQTLGEFSASNLLTTTGPATLYAHQTGTYTLTHFDPARIYHLTPIGGTATRSNGLISYTAPALVGPSGFIVTADGLPASYLQAVNVVPATAVQPQLLLPVAGSNSIGSSVTITANSFASANPGDSPASADWQLALDLGFTQIVTQSLEDASNLTTWSVTGLDPDTTYYVRLRRRGLYSNVSNWSTPLRFSTRASFVVDGPLQLFTQQVVTYTLLNYNPTHTYVVTVSAGSIVQTGATLTFTAPSDPGPVTLGIDAATVTLGVAIATAGTPVLVSPVANSVVVGTSAAIAGAAFTSPHPADVLAEAEWQFASDSSFTSPLDSAVLTGSSPLQWSITPGQNMVCFVRVRVKGQYSAYSNWSAVVSFTFQQPFIVTPAITSPVGNSYLSGPITVSAAAFAVAGGSDTHAATTWQLARDISFTQILQESVQDPDNLVQWPIPEPLIPEIELYLRARYHGDQIPASAWSPPVVFSAQGDGLTTGRVQFAILSNHYSSGGGNTTLCAIADLHLFETDTGPDLSEEPLLASASSTGLGPVNALFDNDPETAWQSASGVYGWTITLNFMRGVLPTIFGLTAPSGNHAVGGDSNTYPKSFSLKIWKHGAWTTLKTIYDLELATSETRLFTLAPNRILTPTLVTPADGANFQASSLTLTSNAFKTSDGGASHTSSSWEVTTADDGDFATPVMQLLRSTAALTAWTTDSLPQDQTYLVRVRYESAGLFDSEWSPAISFRLVNQPDYQYSPSFDAVTVDRPLAPSFNAVVGFVPSPDQPANDAPSTPDADLQGYQGE